MQDPPRNGVVSPSCASRPHHRGCRSPRRNGAYGRVRGPSGCSRRSASRDRSPLAGSATILNSRWSGRLGRLWSASRCTTARGASTGGAGSGSRPPRAAAAHRRRCAARRSRRARGRRRIRARARARHRRGAGSRDPPGRRAPPRARPTARCGTARSELEQGLLEHRAADVRAERGAPGQAVVAMRRGVLLVNDAACHHASRASTAISVPASASETGHVAFALLGELRELRRRRGRHLATGARGDAGDPKALGTLLEPDVARRAQVRRAGARPPRAGRRATS